MKQIKLTQGKYALVADADFEYLNQFHWSIDGSGYPQRANKTPKGWRPIRMHRDILKLKDGEIGDHINRNKLDNQLNNLRKCTPRVNVINRPISKNNTSGYKGVNWDKWSSKWRAEIMVNYKKISLGRFKEIKNAILVRKNAERKYQYI